MHREALSEGQIRLLPALGGFAAEEGLYLGGGTAVALYLGHRLSVDYDLFSSQEIADPMALAGRAGARGLSLEQIQVSRGTLHAVVVGVNISCLEYRYPLIAPLERWQEYCLDVASLDDLVCMKLAAVAQRGARKDFIDIYALGMRHVDLPAMIELYRRKYSMSDVGSVLTALCYFDDAEVEPMPTMLWDVSWDEVKRQIGSWVRGLVR